MDDERKPDTPLRECWNNGVQISSRWYKIAEIRLMIGPISAMPDALRMHLTEVFCDSKACATYTFETHPGTTVECALAIAVWADKWLLENDAGHNGIDVRDDGKDLAGAHPNWAFDGDEI